MENKTAIMQHVFNVWQISLFPKYTGCPGGGNVPEIGRMFLKLKYTDIIQNTYIQSWTVTEVMAREKLGLLVVPRTVPHSAHERVLKRIFP